MIIMTSLYTIPAVSGEAITDALTTHDKARSVHVGTDGDYDFYFPTIEAWVPYQGCKAGAQYPLMVTGARATSGGAAPSAGDITFNY